LHPAVRKAWAVMPAPFADRQFLAIDHDFLPHCVSKLPRLPGCHQVRLHTRRLIRRHLNSEQTNYKFDVDRPHLCHLGQDRVKRPRLKRLCRGTVTTWTGGPSCRILT
jgi:hypothetical protein